MEGRKGGKASWNATCPAFYCTKFRQTTVHLLWVKQVNVYRANVNQLHGNSKSIIHKNEMFSWHIWQKVLSVMCPVSGYGCFFVTCTHIKTSAIWRCQFDRAQLQRWLRRTHFQLRSGLVSSAKANGRKIKWSQEFICRVSLSAIYNIFLKKKG